MKRRKKQQAARYDGLYDGNTPAVKVFAFILETHLRAIRTNTPGCLRGADSRYLHDIRVAFRRIRSAAAFFAPLGIKGSQEKLDGCLKRLCLELGRMRDLQARLELLDNLSFGPDYKQEAYRQKCVSDIAKGMTKLRVVISGRLWAGCLGMVRDLIRKCKLDDGAGISIRCFAVQRISERFAKFSRRDFRSASRRSSESLHDLRKHFRKLRYDVEVCAPAAGAKMANLERLLCKVTGLLGRIHDIDVSLILSSKSSATKHGRCICKVFLDDRAVNLKKLGSALKDAEKQIKGRSSVAFLKATQRRR